MPKNRNALMRIHTIDACLRRRNRLWTIDDLVEACEDALYEYEGVSEISTRTIRRDLQLMRSEKLGYNAPIVVRDRKYYTYEDPDYSITKLPLSADDLNELSSALDIIRHYGGFSSMSAQEDIITRLQDRVQNQDGHARIVYLGTNDRLKGLDFLGVLYDYIVKKTPLCIRYKSFKATVEKVHHISPYILKEYNDRWFLLGYSPLVKRIVTLALDRIAAIDMDSGGEYVENTFFDPESYFDGMVGVSSGKKNRRQEVVIKVDAGTAPYLLTKPLHGSQQFIDRGDDGSVTLTLYVVINLELERLLLGFGSHLEVIGPQHLRDSIAAHVIQASRMYGTGSK